MEAEWITEKGGFKGQHGAIINIGAYEVGESEGRGN